MTAAATIRLVARREVVERVRDKGFLFSTAFGLLLIAAVAFLPSLLGAGEPDAVTVAADAEGLALAEAAVAQQEDFDLEITVVEAGDREDLEAALESGEIDAALIDGGVLVHEELDSALAFALQRAQLPPPPPLEVTALAPPEQEGQADQAGGLAFAITFILYGQLFAYGMWVATGVVEEKTSRVVEILLATVRPSHLLAGKILGIGLLALAQLLLIAAVGLAVVTLTGVVELPQGAAAAIAGSIGWFCLGFLFYACAFGAAGATVTRIEELQNAVSPLTICLIGTFFAAFFVLEDPSGTVARVMSFVPMSAPMIMPIRLTTSTVPVWEVVASVAVTAAATLALIPVAGRIYRGAILRGGGRVPLLAAFRSAAR